MAQTPKTSMPAAKTDKPATLAKQWKERDREGRRDLIVDVAFNMLQDDGADAVTMRRVAGAIGVGAMTLYTYVDGLDDLHRRIIARGFSIIHDNCSSACENNRKHDDDWLPGARVYVRFAIDNPNLYHLMFATPVDPGDDQFDQIIHGGFAGLHEIVRERLSSRGLSDELLEVETRKVAGRYWIGLHGLATLAIAGRMQVLHGSLDEVLEHLLEAVAPTNG
jgi:AcrR family transcriptional regulator